MSCAGPMVAAGAVPSSDLAQGMGGVEDLETLSKKIAANAQEG